MKTPKFLIALGVAGLIYVPTSLTLIYYQTRNEMIRLGGEEWTMNYFSDHITFFRMVLIPFLSLTLIVVGILFKKIRERRLARVLTC